MSATILSGCSPSSLRGRADGNLLTGCSGAGDGTVDDLHHEIVDRDHPARLAVTIARSR